MLGARRFFLAAISTLLLELTFAGIISAQSPGNPMTPTNPTMVGRRLDDDKEALYVETPALGNSFFFPVAQKKDGQVLPCPLLLSVLSVPARGTHGRPYQPSIVLIVVTAFFS